MSTAVGLLVPAMRRSVFFRTVAYALVVAISSASQARPSAAKFPYRPDLRAAGIDVDQAPKAVLPPGVPLRLVSEAGLKVTKLSEAFVAHLYNDSAHYCTIAYGHLVKRAACNGTEPPQFLRGVTVKQGTDLLIANMRKAEIEVMTSVTSPLAQNQYAAICDFVFNVGATNFRHSTLLQVLNASEFDRVAPQMRRWVRAGNTIQKGLENRRAREIALFYGRANVRGVPQPGEDLSPIDIRVGQRKLR